MIILVKFKDYGFEFVKGVRKIEIKNSILYLRGTRFRCSVSRVSDVLELFEI